MKQKLEITKEEALKLYPEASEAIKSIFEASFGVDVFKPTKIIDRIQSFQDVLKILDIYDLIHPFPSSTSKEGKSINALMRLFKVVEAYNEGWVPDWNNSSQYKYYPYFYKGSAGGLVSGCHYWRSRHFPSGLAFKSSELALDAIEKFKDLYKDYFMVS